ncbi:hypothetical protein Bca101_022755 [Brassica carinata]
MYSPVAAEETPTGQVTAGRRAENFTNFARLRGSIYAGGRVEAAASPWVPVAQVGSNTTPSSSATESCLTPATVTGGVLQTFAVPRAVETVRELAGPSSSGVSKTDTRPFQIQPATETEAADERKRKEREEPADDTQVSQSYFDACTLASLMETGGGEGRGSTSRKRSRAAEMHNVSERVLLDIHPFFDRRRREKINEKMKALQELIPRCNKTDKASMLEDAIEYVKSLQMQIQMMSMGGGGMMPMMYTPNMQRFMAPSAMGMMGMNRPPFIPFPGTAFPRPAHMAGLPRYPFAFDPSGVYLPTQQPDPMPDQPQFPGYLNPYSLFVGLQQMQLSPPPQLPYSWKWSIESEKNKVRNLADTLSLVVYSLQVVEIKIKRLQRVYLFCEYAESFYSHGFIEFLIDPQIVVSNLVVGDQHK